MNESCRLHHRRFKLATGRDIPEGGPGQEVQEEEVPAAVGPCRHTLVAAEEVEDSSGLRRPDHPQWSRPSQPGSRARAIQASSGPLGALLLVDAFAYAYLNDTWGRNAEVVRETVRNPGVGCRDPWSADPS